MVGGSVVRRQVTLDLVELVTRVGERVAQVRGSFHVTPSCGELAILRLLGNFVVWFQPRKGWQSSLPRSLSNHRLLLFLNVVFLVDPPYGQNRIGEALYAMW